jgi:hypothetical protein
LNVDRVKTECIFKIISQFNCYFKGRNFRSRLESQCNSLSVLYVSLITSLRFSLPLLLLYIFTLSQTQKSNRPSSKATQLRSKRKIYYNIIESRNKKTKAHTGNFLGLSNRRIESYEERCLATKTPRTGFYSDSKTPSFKVRGALPPAPAGPTTRWLFKAVLAFMPVWSPGGLLDFPNVCVSYATFESWRNDLRYTNIAGVSATEENLLFEYMNGEGVWVDRLRGK